MRLFIFCEQFVDILIFAAVDIVAFNAVVVLYVVLELVIAVVEVDRVQIVVELDFVRPAVFNGGIAQLFDIALEILALLALSAVFSFSSTLLLTSVLPFRVNITLFRTYMRILRLNTAVGSARRFVGYSLPRMLIKNFISCLPSAGNSQKNAGKSTTLTAESCALKTEVKVSSSRFSPSTEAITFHSPRPRCENTGDFTNESSLAFPFSTNIFLIISGNEDAEKSFFRPPQC